MVLGQSSAIAAVMAIDLHLSLQEIPIKKLQEELREDPMVMNRYKQ
jgi:hypothetical protein